MKIKYTEWGFASRVGNVIYLNKDLIFYPKLHKAILKHEKAHSSGFIWEDIKIDLFGKYLNGVKKEYYKFIITHPKTLTQFLPLGYRDKTLMIDPIMLLFWGLILILIMMGIST